MSTIHRRGVLLDGIGKELVRSANGGSRKTLSDWAALVNALGSTPISTDMAPVVQASTKLRALNTLNEDVRFFFPEAATGVGIQAAITAASLAGGGAVLLAGIDYDVSATIVPASNVAVLGVPGRTKLVGSGSSSIALVGTGVSFKTTIADLASDAAVNARSVTLTSGNGVSAGDYILFSATHPTSGDLHEWVTLVTEKATATLTIADPMPIAIAAADVHSISVITPTVRNFTVRDVIFDRGTNTGTSTLGLLVAGGVDVEVSNCVFEDFGAGSRTGIYLYQCAHVFLTDIFSERCGSLTGAAQQFSACTGIRASGLRSYDDDGFGILFQLGAYNQGSGLSCERAGDAVFGRGVKFSGDLRGQFAGIISNNNAYTGVCIADHCVDTSLSNLEVIGNGWNTGNKGLLIAGTPDGYNTGIRVRGVLARGNANEDIGIDAGNNTDIIITDADYGTATNSGTNCVINAPNKMSGVATSSGLTVANTDRLLGRVSSGAGVIEEVAFTDQAQALCDDTSFSAMRTTLGLGSGDAVAHASLTTASGAADTTAIRAGNSQGNIDFSGGDGTRAWINSASWNIQLRRGGSPVFEIQAARSVAHLPIQAKSYTVATLPAGAAGDFAYASDLRVFNGAGTQEGAGAGTGGCVQHNGTVWKILGTNVTAVA